MEKNPSYERRAYESVDDESLSQAIHLRLQNGFRQYNGLIFVPINAFNFNQQFSL